MHRSEPAGSVAVAIVPSRAPGPGAWGVRPFQSLVPNTKYPT